MIPTPTKKWLRLPCLLVILASGCGISDYTGQIANEKALVDYWDKEHKFLGKKIAKPTFPPKEDTKEASKDPKENKDNKDNKPTEWNVFLRLPAGVNDVPTPISQDKKEAQLFNSVLVQYGKYRNTFGIESVYLGVSNDPKEFAKKVYEYFGTSPGGEEVKTIPRSPTLLMGTSKSVASEMVYKVKTFEAQWSYRFYFYEHGKSQVALVFQLDMNNGAKADDAIKYSVATLGVDLDETYPMSKAYSDRNKPPRQK